jgi:hypothetical protein
MNIETNAQTFASDLTPAWGTRLDTVVCERCDWAFLFPEGNIPRLCPHCFQPSLAQLTDQAQELPYTRPAELALPFSASAQSLSQAVQHFARGIPFPPGDLNYQSLQGRMQRMYLPMWLVDASVEATWQAEVGFDYQVISHQDHYDGSRGGWNSHEVKEGRIRWDPRLGRLKRSYQNIVAPALEEQAQLKKVLGDFTLAGAENYRPELISGAAIRLPNRTSQDAWNEAAPAFQAAAAEECRKAASADYIRQFKWQPGYQDQNWTLLLLPLFSTYYLDDEGLPRPVMFHGQSAKPYGSRRASQKRARQTALFILVVALALFVAGVGFAVAGMLTPVLLTIGGLVIILALLVGLAAILPLVIAWQFNRSMN